MARSFAFIAGLVLGLSSSAEAHALTVAALRYEIRGDARPTEILERIRRHAQAASEAEVELLVLPELVALDAWPLASKASEARITRDIAAEITPKLWQGLARIAREEGLAILGGSAPELRDGRMYNPARLFFPDGDVARQDKLHPTAWGREVGFSPGAELRPIDAPWGRTVILICYDVEFPSVSSEMAAMRPELILVPSMTESRAGANRVRFTARARAIEHHAFVLVAPTRGRPSRSWRHFGEVEISTPRDRDWPGEIPRTEVVPDLFRGRLDLDALRKSRSVTKWYPARDERGAALASD